MSSTLFRDGDNNQKYGLTSGAGSAADPSSPQVGGISKTISATFTRPSNTTAYVAGDMVANATSGAVDIDFLAVARENGGSGVIQSAHLILGSNEATKGDFQLWLFNTAIAMENDNEPWAPADSELQTLAGFIDFGSTAEDGDATVGASGNCVYQKLNIGLPFKCAASVDDLFGVLIVRNSFTPTASTPFYILLHILQD